MYLKKYISDNFEKVFGQPMPKHIELILDNISANHYTLRQFTQHFNLGDVPFEALIDFILNPENSYEIGKFGNRVYATKQSAKEKDYITNRKRTTSDISYDYEQGNFTKKSK